LARISVLGEQTHEFDGAVSALDVLRSIDPRPKGVISAKVNGALTDLSALVEDGSVVEFVIGSSPDGLSVIRHSTAHVMAQAVLELYPGAKYAIGPSIADGFYYDFELPDIQPFAE
jgi:threonyl-tRNA synthetase